MKGPTYPIIPDIYGQRRTATYLIGKDLRVDLIDWPFDPESTRLVVSRGEVDRIRNDVG
jgi:hypothetical protein